MHYGFLNKLFRKYIQHQGIYGYSFAALEKFISLPVSFYEQLEGLEQLRFMENNIPIKLIMLADNINLWRGVDTVDDAQFVASLLEQKE
jgi:3-deoxy-manno-octulosonate cytidylyltransferase (CMP-KDO synthetase)